MGEKDFGEGQPRLAESCGGSYFERLRTPRNFRSIDEGIPMGSFFFPVISRCGHRGTKRGTEVERKVGDHRPLCMILKSGGLPLASLPSQPFD